MSDNKQKKGRQERIRINFNESYEIAYWTGKWNVSEMQLQTARRVTGSVLVKEIAAYLKDNGLIA